MNIIIPADIDALPENSISLPHAGDYYLNILSCLGYTSEAAPVADLIKQMHGLTGEWLVASPISWQATHNDVMVMASGKQLQCLEEEGRAWFAALTELATSWGFETFYHDAWTWLIRPHQTPALHAKPVSHLIHRSMMPILQAIDKTMYWQRLLTEAQLFFSSHVLNRQRPTQLPVNGLWFWGGGSFCQHHHPIIVQDDSLFSLTHILSNHVQIAAKKRRYAKETIFLIKQLDEEVLRTINVRRRHTWYWNNQTYQPKSRPWWSMTSRLP